MFKSLKDLIKERVRYYQFKREIEGEEIISKWNEIIKEKFGEGKAKAISFKGDCLRVEVKNPVLAQELRIREEEIKKEINSLLKKEYPGASPLKRIIYRISA